MQHVDAAGALTPALLDEQKAIVAVLSATDVPPVVLSALRRTSSSAERWRATVARWWPTAAVDDALAVMQCESGGSPRAFNAASGAAGLFQFLRGTWNDVARALRFGDYESGAVYDPELNIRAAAYLWQTAHGFGPWSCKP